MEKKIRSRKNFIVQISLRAGSQNNARASGENEPAIGDWRLAIGDWRLAIGDWPSRSPASRLVFARSIAARARVIL